MTNNYFISMQKGFLALTTAALLFSCSSIEPFDASELVESQEKIAVQFKTINPNARIDKNVKACGTALHSQLIAAQNIPIGEVSVYNDENNFYVTVSIDKGEYVDNNVTKRYSDDEWFIKNININFGQVDFDIVTKTKKGIRNPAPGKFPLNLNVDINFDVTAEQEYTFTVPMDADFKKKLSVLGEFDVAVHADVVTGTVAKDDSGYYLIPGTIKTEGAWAKGQSFNADVKGGNWAMFMSYTIQPCTAAVACTGEWKRNESYLDEDATGKENEETVEFGNFIIKEVGLVEFQRIRTNLSGSNRKYTITVDYSILPELIGKGYSFQEFTAYTTGNLEENPNFIATKTNGGEGNEPHTSGQIILEYTLTEAGGNQGQNFVYWQGFEAKLNGLCLPIQP